MCNYIMIWHLYRCFWLFFSWRNKPCGFILQFVQKSWTSLSLCLLYVTCSSLISSQISVYMTIVILFYSLFPLTNHIILHLCIIIVNVSHLDSYNLFQTSLIFIDSSLKGHSQNVRKWYRFSRMSYIYFHRKVHYMILTKFMWIMLD